MLLTTFRHLSRPFRPFWGPLAAILDCTGGERVPPSPLGWYFPILSDITWFYKVFHEDYNLLNLRYYKLKNTVRYCLISSTIIKYQRIFSDIVKYCQHYQTFSNIVNYCQIIYFINGSWLFPKSFDLFSWTYFVTLTILTLIAYSAISSYIWNYLNAI